MPSCALAQPGSRLIPPFIRILVAVRSSASRPKARRKPTASTAAGVGRSDGFIRARYASTSAVEVGISSAPSRRASSAVSAKYRSHSAGLSLRPENAW